MQMRNVGKMVVVSATTSERVVTEEREKSHYNSDFDATAKTNNVSVKILTSNLIKGQACRTLGGASGYI